ncbi:MFS transporter [Phytohabitans kaempferiae]|uniref:MFS transporter n=1 Tax=Phytohabitans kaempferiae TaxID=1620943 RepID=A0ABV6MBB5_9ACTN
MSLGVFTIVGSELLPASMLTTMASDLDVSEGLAGQSVTISALVAMVVCVLTPSATSRVDRRVVLLILSLLLTISNIAVAWSTGYVGMMSGRVALGIAVGGFWSMSAAATVRMVPERRAPRALSVVFSGIAAATVVAAPLGAYVSDAIGWRNAFWLMALMSGGVLLFQFLTLPRLAPTAATTLRTIGDVLMRPGIAVGILSATALYIVHVAYQTYIRPVLESVPETNSRSIALAFLALGVGGVLGTAASSVLMERNLRLTLTLTPIVMAMAGLAIAFGSADALPHIGLMLGWGLAYGVVPVAWSLWLTRMVPDQRETASGIFVAAVQISIAIGAGAGGLVFDHFGSTALYAAGAVLVIAASGAVYRTTRGANIPPSVKGGGGKRPDRDGPTTVRYVTEATDIRHPNTTVTENGQ